MTLSHESWVYTWLLEWKDCQTDLTGSVLLHQSDRVQLGFEKVFELISEYRSKAGLKGIGEVANGQSH